MAYKLIWSPAARDDLHDIVVFIARDNPNRAMSFGYELISEIDRLQEFPELGRIVPEYRNDGIREIIFGRIELCTASIMTQSSVRLRAFGIQREEPYRYEAKTR
jgi:toxin ParE1/3/4